MRELFVPSGRQPGALTSVPNNPYVHVGSRYRPRTKYVTLHRASFICVTLLALLVMPNILHSEDGMFERNQIHKLEKYVFYNDYSNELRKFETSQLVLNFVSVGPHTLEEMVATNLQDFREFNFGKITTTILPKGRLQHVAGVGVITIVFGSKKGIQKNNILEILKESGDGFEIYETGSVVSKVSDPNLYNKRTYMRDVCTSLSSLDTPHGNRVFSIIFVENTNANSNCFLIQFMWLIGFANISNSIGAGGFVDTFDLSNEIEILMDNALISGMKHESFGNWKRLKLQ